MNTFASGEQYPFGGQVDSGQVARCQRKDEGVRSDLIEYGRYDFIVRQDGMYEVFGRIGELRKRLLHFYLLRKVYKCSGRLQAGHPESIQLPTFGTGYVDAFVGYLQALVAFVQGRLISLRSVLLQYLVRTALACLLVAVGWLLALMLWIQNGELFLPANQAAQACQKAAQDVLPGMTAATFDETQLDSLCRYALFAAPDSSEVLATNMDAGHLQRAMENRQGKTRWHFGYTQYYMTSKLQDGTVCLLQFDYAVPYADPALRGVLPDMQTVHCILGILLLVGAVVWSTHRTGRFLTRETEKLTAAAQAVARKDLDSAVFSGAKVREYESTLQALQTMGDALTGSLQKQWAMEQRQREQIIQLSHKLKTPLTIIEGNAELLAEDDDLTAEQKAQVESILQGAEQTRTYLGKIRAEVQTPLRYKRNAEQ